MYKLSYIIFLRVSLGFYSFDSRFKPYKSNTPFESRRANPRACERAGKIIVKIKNTLFSPRPRTTELLQKLSKNLRSSF